MTIKHAIKFLQWNIQEDHQTGDFNGSPAVCASWGALICNTGWEVCEDNVQVGRLGGKPS